MELLTDYYEIVEWIKNYAKPNNFSLVVLECHVTTRNINKKFYLVGALAF